MIYGLHTLEYVIGLEKQLYFFNRMHASCSGSILQFFFVSVNLPQIRLFIAYFTMVKYLDKQLTKNKQTAD